MLQKSNNQTNRHPSDQRLCAMAHDLKDVAAIDRQLHTGYVAGGVRDEQRSSKVGPPKGLRFT